MIVPVNQGNIVEITVNIDNATISGNYYVSDNMNLSFA